MASFTMPPTVMQCGGSASAAAASRSSLSVVGNRWNVARTAGMALKRLNVTHTILYSASMAQGYSRQVERKLKPRGKVPLVLISRPQWMHPR